MKKYHYNQKIQVNCFEGMFQALNNIDWIEGIFIWEEEINSPPVFFDENNTRFSIINKEAAQIIARYFRNDISIDNVENIEIQQRKFKKNYLYRIIHYAKWKLSKVFRN